MKLVDYFFSVLVSIFTIPCSDARMRASGLLSLWVAFFTVFILSSIGLIMDNPVSEVLKKPNEIFYFFFLMPYMLVLFAIAYIRYERNETRYLKIAEWRNGLSKQKARVLYIIFLVVFWSMPILLFITFRLYRLGYVWWF